MTDNSSSSCENKTEKKWKLNTKGFYISLCFIVVGLVWYAVNIGIIPVSLIQKQAGPIIVVIIGFLILIKSVSK